MDLQTVLATIGLIFFTAMAAFSLYLWSKRDENRKK